MRRVKSSKPPYRIPTMEEINAIPFNGLNVVSTFSGTGGSSLGYRWAGCKVLWASEFVEAARDSYRANFPDTFIDERDIRTVEPDDILEQTGLKRGELDIFDGSPPCASFSLAGKREKAWGQVKNYSETQQVADDLFFEYARILRGLQPKVFVAENVPGLLVGKAKGYFKNILAELKGCGYRVAARVIDSKWLGVPQTRRRLIFIGVRNDIERAPVHPKPLPYQYTLSDAIQGVRVVHDTSGLFSSGDVTEKPCPTITVSGGAAPVHFKVFDEPPGDPSIERYAIGAEWEKLAPGAQSEKYMNLVKAHPERPSPTVTATGSILGAASVVHPTEKRKFTIAELRRICGFPDDFVLTGNYQQQWERLGRAVSPPAMRAIAATLRDEVLCAG